jgi:hypothetical protein
MSAECFWLAPISEQFQEGPPNGWLLGWPRDRFFPQLAEAVAPERVENQTSFDYSFCNRYEVRVDGLAGNVAVLTIRISFVADAFSLHWTKYNLEMTTSVPGPVILLLS